MWVALIPYPNVKIVLRLSQILRNILPLDSKKTFLVPLSGVSFMPFGGSMDFVQIEGPVHRGLLKQIHHLQSELLVPVEFEEFEYEYQSKTHLLNQLVFVNDELIAYKIGHEKKQNTFYSWQGGVKKEYRGQGLASRLLEIQHRWAEDKGYKTILTHSENHYKDMMVLNLNFGYDVRGTFLNSRGVTKIVFEKELQS